MVKTCVEVAVTEAVSVREVVNVEEEEDEEEEEEVG